VAAAQAGKRTDMTKISEDSKHFEWPAIIISGYGDGTLWVANFVGLTSCWVEGKDREDVIRRAPAVLAEYIESCVKAHWPIPDPPSVDELESTKLGEVITVQTELKLK
jgi:predicted RNase H-like HicB family nuclease